jgi:ADP-ribose pyrophosphatase YjhB (NUDIX family)
MLKQPRLAVDVIIRYPKGVVLVARRNPPYGWALPGGFVEYGETVEAAACREAQEETGLKLKILRHFGVYSEPDRDPRGHTVSVVFTARAEGELKPGSDARMVKVFPLNALPKLAFDHKKILADYRCTLKKR